MISPCIEPDCSTLCMGLFCITHAPKPTREFPLGRPWPPLAMLAEARTHIPEARALVPKVAQPLELMPARPTA